MLSAVSFWCVSSLITSKAYQLKGAPAHGDLVVAGAGRASAWGRPSAQGFLGGGHRRGPAGFPGLPGWFFRPGQGSGLSGVASVAMLSTAGFQCAPTQRGEGGGRLGSGGEGMHSTAGGWGLARVRVSLGSPVEPISVDSKDWGATLVMVPGGSSRRPWSPELLVHQCGLPVVVAVLVDQGSLEVRGH